MAKILILDIETIPSMVYVWRFFKENIAPKQVIQNSTILSFAAKWYDSTYIFYDDISVHSETKVITNLLRLLDEADIVVAHYGSKFDLPKINARAIVLGLKPPSPYKVIDTKMVASKNFFFESNSLEHLANVLGCAPKQEHKEFPGFNLWIECMKGNPKAFEECKKYNVQDVLTLEEIYEKLIPWIPNPPNFGVYSDTETAICPKCGGTHLQKRGFYYTNVNKYQRYQCQECGGWSRGRFTNLEKVGVKTPIVNAV